MESGAWARRRARRNRPERQLLRSGRPAPRRARPRRPTREASWQATQIFKFAKRLRVARGHVGEIGRSAGWIEVAPRARAFDPLRALHNDADVGRVRQPKRRLGHRRPEFDRNVRGDADLGKINVFERLQMLGIAEIDPWRGFEGRADLLLGASDLDRAGDDEPQHADRLPGPGQLVIPPRGGDGWKLLEMDRAMGGVSRRPGFLGGENQDRREPNRHGAENVLDRLHGPTPPDARWGIAVERVLANIEIEGGEVGVNEGGGRHDGAG